MIKNKGLLILIPIITLTFIVLIVTILYSVSTPQQKTTNTILIQPTNASNLNGGIIYKDNNENHIMLFMGIALGALGIVELALILEVIAQKRRTKKLEEDYLKDKKREQIRGALLGRLDYLLYRYNEMAELTERTNHKPDRLLLPSGKRK